MMRFDRLNLVLGAGLALLLGLNWWSRPDPGMPGLEFAPQMAHSARYAAFAQNPNFPDGQTLRAPEPDTIARGQSPLHYAPTPADAVRAGLELQNPISSADSAALARGATLFAGFCGPCHGATAHGDGVVVRRGFPPPPSLLETHAIGLRDGQMFHILTYGQGNMASYASQLARDDRWKVVVNIRSLQQGSGAVAEGAAR
jgi:mono/diheme cytochrome c family protein